MVLEQAAVLAFSNKQRYASHMMLMSILPSDFLAGWRVHSNTALLMLNFLTGHCRMGGSLLWALLPHKNSQH